MPEEFVLHVIHAFAFHGVRDHAGGLPSSQGAVLRAPRMASWSCPSISRTAHRKAPLADKFRAFRWAVREIDGHDHEAIRGALSTAPWEPGKPSCVIAHTVKGKGVDYMENKLLWHYRAPDPQLLKQALQQLGAE